MKGSLIITGANGQVGSYLARRYHALGYSLILLYHQRTERINDLIGEEDICILSADLSDYAAVADAVAHGIRFTGKEPEVLIHTASVRSSDALVLNETDPEQWERVFDANLKGAYHILRVVTPYMVKASHGRVVMFGSDVTRSGLARGSAYAAAKAAIANMVRSQAQELHPNGVFINIVSPGPIETVLEEDYTGEYLEFRKQYFREYLAASPDHRLVTKEEIGIVIDGLIGSNEEIGTGREIFFAGGID